MSWGCFFVSWVFGLEEKNKNRNSLVLWLRVILKNQLFWWSGYCLFCSLWFLGWGVMARSNSRVVRLGPAGLMALFPAHFVPYLATWGLCHPGHRPWRGRRLRWRHRLWIGMMMLTMIRYEVLGLFVFL